MSAKSTTKHAEKLTKKTENKPIKCTNKRTNKHKKTYPATILQKTNYQKCKNSYK